VFNQLSNVQSQTCIDWYQNSGTQAPIISGIVRNCDIKAGDKMLVHIEGGCSQFVYKRSQLPDRMLQRRQTIQVSSSNATLRNPNGDGSLTYVAVDLGELANGHYDVQITLDGQVTNVTVLDSDGEEYAR
jgi:hypothetical protein